MNNKFTKDINNIINNYLDYSIKKLNKILNTLKQLKINLKLKPYITIEDIIFICTRLGYQGFYMDTEEYEDIITEVDKLLSPYKFHEEYDEYSSRILYNINGIIITEHLFACENAYIIGTDWIDKSEQINFIRLNLHE